MRNRKPKMLIDGQTLFLLAETARLREFVRRAWQRIRELEEAFVNNQADVRRAQRGRHRKTANLNE